MFIRKKGAFTCTIPAPPLTDDDAVVLHGRCLNHQTQLGLSDSLLARGVLLLGASRSGKSVIQSKMIRQVKERMGPQDVLLVLDTKGEYAAAFYQPGDFVLGTGGPYAPNANWNLFRDCVSGCQTKRELEQRIGMIANRIFCRENVDVPYFTDAPRRVLEILLDALLRHPECLPAGERLDNHGLLAFLRRGNWDRIFDCCQASQELGSYIGRGTRTPTEKSVLSELNINLTRQLCGSWGGHGDFSMTAFEAERVGRTLYLQYDLGDGGASDPIYQLLVDLFLTGFMARKNRGGKLYLFLDELHLLGQSPECLSRALNYGPGIGLGTICVGAQSLAQLQCLCGQEGAATLLAGLQTRIMFHTEDWTSTEFVRQQCGKTPTKVVTYIPGIALQEMDGPPEPAVSDTELASLTVGQAVIKEPSYPAFFFQFDP